LLLIQILNIVIMTRKEFFSRVGAGAALVLVPSCIGGLASSCSNDSSPNAAPSNVDFTLDVSSGTLSNNGGYLVHNGIVVAKTNSGEYIAVSASCTHEGTNVNYNASANKFVCPNHGAQFSNTGSVIQGPANRNLTKYNTTLMDTMLRVFS
jgi:cytochrome b6-f complex iron-sulfur subunit